MPHRKIDLKFKAHAVQKMDATSTLLVSHAPWTPALALAHISDSMWQERSHRSRLLQVEERTYYLTLGASGGRGDIAPLRTPSVSRVRRACSRGDCRPDLDFDRAGDAR